MSLSERLAAAEEPRPKYAGCRTCQWMATLADGDLAAMHTWFAEGRSLRKFWLVASSDPENPLPVSNTGLKNHMTHHEFPPEYIQ